MPALAAAGGVLWQRGRAGLQVAVAHRPRYDDWSFAKGKLRSGEHPLTGAIREVEEETAMSVTVGRRLPAVSYPTAAGVKTVQYWSMQATGDFVPNAEVDVLEWLDPPAAATRLSYQDDVTLLAALQRDGPGPLHALLVRHARAGSRSRWEGPDEQRPLDERGLKQAARLGNLLLRFGPSAVYAADRVRCVQTVLPLAERLGVPVGSVELFSEEGYWPDPRRGRRAFRDLMTEAATVVVCSQGGVIPDLIRASGLPRERRTGTDAAEPPARKASVWALSASEGRVVGADYYPAIADS